MSSDCATDITAVVLAWNQAEVTRRCVERVAPLVGQVFLVDNHSEPAEARVLSDLANDRVTVITNPQNLGYAGGCNKGIAAALEAGCAAVLVMNNDAFPEAGGVRLLAERLRAKKRLGAVGPAVVQHETGELLHVACDVDLRTGGTCWQDRGAALASLGSAPAPTGYVGGEAMLMRTEALQDIGAFNPAYFCYYEDVDWCVRARMAGWELEALPAAVWSHMVGTTSTSMTAVRYQSRNRVLFLRSAVGKGRIAAMARSMPRTVSVAASLLVRGHLLIALRGAIAGWFAGGTAPIA